MVEKSSQLVKGPDAAADIVRKLLADQEARTGKPQDTGDLVFMLTILGGDSTVCKRKKDPKASCFCRECSEYPKPVAEVFHPRNHIHAGPAYPMDGKVLSSVEVKVGHNNLVADI